MASDWLNIGRILWSYVLLTNNSVLSRWASANEWQFTTDTIIDTINNTARTESEICILMYFKCKLQVKLAFISLTHLYNLYIIENRKYSNFKNKKKKKKKKKYYLWLVKMC